MVINASGLTKTQIEELRKALVSKLSGLDVEIKELESSLTRGENDDKGAPDEVDRSSFEEEMQRMQLVLDGKKNLKFEVLDAVKRIDDSTYGVCEETEEPIGFARLRAQPWTRLSLEAQQELEQRRKGLPRNAAGGAYPSAYNGDEGGGAGAEE